MTTTCTSFYLQYGSSFITLQVYSVSFLRLPAFCWKCKRETFSWY